MGNRDRNREIGLGRWGEYTCSNEPRGVVYGQGRMGKKEWEEFAQGEEYRQGGKDRGGKEEIHLGRSGQGDKGQGGIGKGGMKGVY